MKIVLTSDTHNQHEVLSAYGWLPDADMIIHSGDLSLRGSLEEVNLFFNWFIRLEQYKYKIFIAGNHDFILEKRPDLFKDVLPPNTYYLNDSGIEIEGIKIWGSPIQPYFHNWAFNRRRGIDIQKHWDLIPFDTNILVTHGPPYNILDYVENGRFQKDNEDDNVGCKDLMNKIESLTDLKISTFGHIHEGYGDLVSNGKKFFNASFLDRKYRPTNMPHIIEI